VPPAIRVVGLGPHGLDRLPGETRELLLDPGVQVVVRTLQHPAASELAGLRDVSDCDDLYEAAGTFEEVYREIADRVRRKSRDGAVVYAVPGSPLIGEAAVRLLASDQGVTVEPGESFLDLAMLRLGLDPIERGLQIIDGNDLPEPLLLHLPTLITQVDTRGAVDSVHDGLVALLDADTPIVRLADLGGPDEEITTLTLEDLRPDHAGLRVTLFLDVDPPGWPGLVRTNARLRRECPWDREQTHHSLARHLLEEAYETLEAIEALPREAPEGPPDVAAYVELEEELGDLLLQVVFHATLAAESGVFGVEEVAEAIRRKLIARHPHVFGDAEAATAEHVLANWENLKREEKGRASLLDGVPRAQPALARARALQSRSAGVGFDWSDISGVIAKVREELEEALAPDADRTAEIGDLLFSVVNLARHLDVEPEQALRTAADRFESRFRVIEESGDPTAMTLEEMDELWEEAKRNE
jgi:tetrapyrrole methylase family protein/MazG family protein